MENNFMLRTISTIVMFIMVLCVVFLGDTAFYIAILVIALFSYGEWMKMTQNKIWALKMLGNVVIIAPNAAMIYIYSIEKTLFLWMALTIWSNDIFAYITGKMIKGPKLCQKISANKTISGFLGGVIISSIIGSLTLYFSSYSSKLAIYTPFIAIIATISDLFESYIKRMCNVKDSGNIIPGHGGVLDRVDGFIFSAPFVAYLLYLVV